MRVRTASIDELRRRTRRNRASFIGPLRALDHGEQREVVHLLRTRQATAPQLAARYGVSLRTVQRYLSSYPAASEYEAAARRLSREADRLGLTLNRDECIRLACAAIVGNPLEARGRTPENRSVSTNSTGVRA